MRLQVVEHELELVHRPQLEHQVFRPHALLIVRQEVLELEVLRDRRVLRLRGDLNEAPRISISVGGRSGGTANAMFRRPAADVVQADAAGALGAEGRQRDLSEIADRAERRVDLNRENDVGAQLTARAARALRHRIERGVGHVGRGRRRRRRDSRRHPMRRDHRIGIAGGDGGRDGPRPCERKGDEDGNSRHIEHALRARSEAARVRAWRDVLRCGERGIAEPRSLIFG